MLDLSALLQNSRIRIEIIFDPGPIHAVKTSHTLEETLEGYGREEPPSGGCLKLAVCLTREVQCSDEVV